MGSRSRTRGAGDAGGLPTGWWVLLGALVLGTTALVLPSGAFTAIDSGRPTNVDAAAPSEALLGLDIADSVSVGAGPAPCGVGSATVVTGRHSGGVDAPGDVVVRSGARVSGGIDAGGCVEVESGARVSGPVTAGGDVTVRSGGRIRGDVEAGGDVSLDSGARIRGDVRADGQVSLASGARIRGDVYVGSAGDVHLARGARISGQIITGWGSGGAGPQFLLTVTNQLTEPITVTVTLTDPGDGTLQTGSSSGQQVQLYLAEGAAGTVDIVPSAGAGGQIEVAIDAQSVGGASSVSVTETVPTTS